jgi:hypothetical protein
MTCSLRPGPCDSRCVCRYLIPVNGSSRLGGREAEGLAPCQRLRLRSSRLHFAVGDTRFVREGARRYLTNRELDEVAKSGEVPHEQAKTLLSQINGYAVVHDSTYHPIELDNRYTMPGEDEPRSVRGPGLLRVLPCPCGDAHAQRCAGFDLTETDPDMTDVLTLLDRPGRGPDGWSSSRY